MSRIEKKYMPSIFSSLLSSYNLTEKDIRKFTTSYGIDINCISNIYTEKLDEVVSTPLIGMCHAVNPDHVESICRSGADPNLRNGYESPLESLIDLVTSVSDKKIITDCEKCIAILLKYGAQKKLSRNLFAKSTEIHWTLPHISKYITKIFEECLQTPLDLNADTVFYREKVTDLVGQCFINPIEWDFVKHPQFATPLYESESDSDSYYENDYYEMKVRLFRKQRVPRPMIEDSPSLKKPRTF